MFGWLSSFVRIREGELDGISTSLINISTTPDGLTEDQYLHFHNSNSVPLFHLPRIDTPCLFSLLEQGAFEAAVWG